MTVGQPPSTRVKIVITGASGFVGRELVPLLLARGVELLLVGRDVTALSAAFPGIRCCSYHDLPIEARGYDCLLHLAVLNTHVVAERDAFMAANVAFLLDVVGMAKAAGIGHFINVSSIHALDEGNASPYAESKRVAFRQLSRVSGIVVTTLYLPLVYGDVWPRSLSALNWLPTAVARALFSLLASFKPTLHVSKLAEFLIAHSRSEAADEIVLTDGQGGNAAFRVVKRMMDLGCALVLALLLWWAIVLIWGLIRATSSGPGFFSQTRVGRSGRLFKCYKFRTMFEGAPNVATHDASPALITPLGRFLRRTKLDELPQIFNVLCNDMSFIGPRPCLPTQSELIEARRMRGVLRLKPGISGLAQVNGIDMSDPERLAVWDARYLALACLTLDMKIALATILGAGKGDAVRTAGSSAES